MNTSRALALLCLGTIFTSAWAAEPAPPAQHWYQVTLNGGKEVKTFTGSSSLDAKNICTFQDGTGPIVLENLRDVFARPGDSEMKWHPVAEGVKVYIAPRTVLYISELPGDPVELEKSGKASFSAYGL